MGSQRLDQLAEAADLDGSELLYVLKDGTDRHIKSDTFADTADRVFLDRDYDVHPDNPALDNREGINQAIADAFDNRRLVELLLLPGTHAIDAKVGHDATATAGAFIHLKGAGRNSTELQQQTDTEDVMSWTNTVSNTTALVVSDLGLEGGRRGLHLLRTAYSLFFNLAFTSQVSESLAGGVYGSVEVEGTTNDNLLLAAYFAHSDAAYSIHNVNGERFYVRACNIGEDVGGIRSQGYTHIDGCDIDAIDKADTLPATGVSSFRVQDGGLWVANSQIRTRAGADHVFTTDLNSDNNSGNEPTGLWVTDCQIELNDGCNTLLLNNRMSAPSAVMKLAESTVRFNGTSGPKTVLDEHRATTAEWVRDSQMNGNTFLHDAAVSAQFHDGILDPARNNRVTDNVAKAF